MKKLKDGYEGKSYYVKSLDKNLILEDDPTMIDWYDQLGLDVLENVKKKTVKDTANEKDKVEKDDNTEQESE